MKPLGNALALVGVVAVGIAVYQYLSSQSLDRRVVNSERRIDDVAQLNQVQEKTLKVHQDQITSHSGSLETQGRTLSEVEKRVTAAETLLGDLARASEAARSELAKLRTDLEELKNRSAADEKRRREMEELARELKKSRERDAEREKRLTTIEKQLGIERPQP